MRRATTIVAAAAVAVTSLAATTLAQNTRLVFEGSVNGGPWRTNYVGALPGDAVSIRVSAQLINTTGTALGFAGITFQPTLSGWDYRAGDLATSFDPFVDTRGGGGVAPVGIGRSFPFNTAAPMTSSSPSGTLTTVVDGGTTLRWTGMVNTMGGTTTIRGAGLSQLTSTALGTSFNRQESPVLFAYRFVLGTGRFSESELLASAPANLVHLARATWYTRADNQDLITASISQQSIVPLRVIIPGPGAAAFALAGWLVAIRRRGRALPEMVRLISGASGDQG